MVSEIVDHRDPSRLAAHFLAAADASEGQQCLADLLEGHVVEMRGGDGHGRIAHVEFADHADFKTLAEDGEGRHLASVVHLADVIAGIGRKTDLEHGGGTFLGQRAAVRVVSIEENHAFARHDLHEAAEAGHHVLEVAEDIRVVELDVVHDEQLGQVVDELAALVEKRRVVFVAFEDEVFRIPESATLSEIVRDAADEPRWLEAGRFENPGEERCGRGFAVRAGDHEVVAPAQEENFQRLRQRVIEQLPVEDGFHFGIAAGHGIADDHEVGIGRDVLRTESFADRDPLSFEEGGHRRINIVIRSGDLDAAIAQRGSERAHRRAADASEMDFAQIVCGAHQ